MTHVTFSVVGMIGSFAKLLLNAAEFVHSTQEQVTVMPGSGPGEFFLSCFYVENGEEVSIVYRLPIPLLRIECDLKQNADYLKNSALLTTWLSSPHTLQTLRQHERDCSICTVSEVLAV